MLIVSRLKSIQKMGLSFAGKARGFLLEGAELSGLWFAEALRLF
jgi:hypothetical protein